MIVNGRQLIVPADGKTHGKVIVGMTTSLDGFVADRSGGVHSAIAQATAAAGDKAVQVVGGVSVARQLLHAGLVDELQVDVMPELFGAGLRFLDDGDLERVRLEKLDVQEVGARTSLSFRVRK